MNAYHKLEFVQQSQYAMQHIKIIIHVMKYSIYIK